MNIAHIQGIFSPEHGGPTRSLTNYCQQQAVAGHAVSAWVLEGFPNTSSAIRLEPPVEMHVCRVDAPARLGGSAEMRRQLREAESPDIYHLHGAWLRAMYYGAAEAVRRKRPYMLETMGMYEPWCLRQKWLQKRVARWWYQDRVLRNAACLHVNSQQEADFLRASGFKAPIAIIPVGVDLGKIETLKLEIKNKGINSTPHLGTTSSDLRPPSPRRGEGNLPERGGEGVESGSQKAEIHSGWLHELQGRPFVLFLSRLHPKKGLDLLIRSWAAVQRSRHSTLDARHSDWLLVIAGTGAQEYVNECRQLAEQLGIANQCLWMGHVDEAQKSWLFTHAHCYVLPTSSENFGNTVAEALAHGTPVITTHHTPWTDLSKHHCGWLVDNTENDLARALEEAMQMNAAARQEMGGKGAMLVRSRYSLELVCRNILSVYDWMLDKGPKPEFVV